MGSTSRRQTCNMRIELAKAVFVSIVVKKHNKQKTSKNYRHAKDFQLEPSVLIVSKFGSMFGTCIHVFGGL